MHHQRRGDLAKLPPAQPMDLMWPMMFSSLEEDYLVKKSNNTPFMFI
jgi:hypothetical protein